MLTGAALAPGDADFPSGNRRVERADGEIEPVGQTRINGQFGKQGRAQPRFHHLHQRMKRGGGEVGPGVVGVGLAGRTHRKRVITQAMAVLQQQERLIRQHGRIELVDLRQAMIRRGGEQELVFQQPCGLDAGRIIGQGDERRVQTAILERLNQPMGQVLAQEEFELGIMLAQAGQGLGQEEGRNGGNHPQTERAGQRLARRPSHMDKIFRFGQHDPGARHRRLPGRRQGRAPSAALDQGRAENGLELLNAGGQGGLGDVGGFGGAGERAMLGQRKKEGELSKRGQVAAHSAS